MNLMRGLVHFLLSGASVLIVAAILPGMKVRSYFDAVGFAIVVAVLNTIVWRVFFFLSWPLAIVTLGGFALLINGLVFLLAQKVVPGVRIAGWLTAIVAAVLVTLCNWALNQVFR